MKEITVYDLNGDSLNDLVQWDADVMVCIRRPEITKEYPVHFFNRCSDEAYVVDGAYAEGILKAKIPNILLRDDKVITGYVYVTESGESKSIYGFRLQVRSRPKPSDIVFVDTKDWVDITGVLEECRDYANSASGSAEAAEKSQEASAQSEKNAGQSASDAADSAKAAADSAGAADTSAQAASASEKAAENWKKLAESFAHGDTGAREGEETDNAREYARQAEESAKKAAEYAGGDVVLHTEVGQPDGVASLDKAGKVPVEQIPDKDTAEDTVTFDDADPSSETGFPAIENITSGEKHKSIFAKLRVWGRGISKLITLLGSTDISEIGDGTVTSALVALMADKLNKTDIVNDLLSTAADKALSAAMGKQLQDAVSKLNTEISGRILYTAHDINASYTIPHDGRYSLYFSAIGEQFGSYANIRVNGVGVASSVSTAEGLSINSRLVTNLKKNDIVSTEAVNLNNRTDTFTIFQVVEL